MKRVVVLVDERARSETTNLHPSNELWWEGVLGVTIESVEDVPDPVIQTFTVKVTSPEGFEPVTEELLNVVLARYWMGGLRRAEVTEVAP